ELSGQAARVAGVRDARGRKLLVEGAAHPQERQGASLTLTLDRHLQYLTEKALARAVEGSRAKAGMAVVLDPDTGELLTADEVERHLVPFRDVLRQDRSYRDKVLALPYSWDPLVEVTPAAHRALDALLAS